MLRIPVESSDIVAIGYDEPSRTLEIEFQNDRVYQYRDVEPDVYAQFMRADSYGQFFSTFIDRRYRYKKIEKTDEKPGLSGAVAFVIGNPRRLAELRAACQQFGIEVEQLELPVDEIQSENAEEIAVKKAKQAYRLAGRPVVVNDSFWTILALRGFPGAYMGAVTEWLHAEDFLKLMEGKPDRTIVLTETVAYYDGKKSKVFSREHRGTITDAARGNGQSIEQIVVMNGQTQTIAELAEQGKSSLENPKETAYYDFAKWFNMHRRIAASASR